MKTCVDGNDGLFAHEGIEIFERVRLWHAVRHHLGLPRDLLRHRVAPDDEHSRHEGAGVGQEDLWVAGVTEDVEPHLVAGVRPPDALVHGFGGLAQEAEVAPEERALARLREVGELSPSVVHEALVEVGTQRRRRHGRQHPGAGRGKHVGRLSPRASSRWLVLTRLVVGVEVKLADSRAV